MILKFANTKIKPKNFNSHQPLYNFSKKRKRKRVIISFKASCSWHLIITIGCHFRVRKREQIHMNCVQITNAKSWHLVSHFYATCQQVVVFFLCPSHSFAIILATQGAASVCPNHPASNLAFSAYFILLYTHKYKRCSSRSRIPSSISRFANILCQQIGSSGQRPW